MSLAPCTQEESQKQGGGGISIMQNKLWIVTLVALLSSAQIHAQAYKCKTSSGKTLISDTPCAEGNRAVSVVQAEHISLERRQEAAAVHEKRLAEVKRIDAEYDARVAEQQRIAALKTSPAHDNYKNRACEAASKPYPGSQGGLTAAQLQTLAACGGMNVPPARNEYAPPLAQNPSPLPKPAPSHLIDVSNGRVLPSIGGGNFIEPKSGTVMHGVAGGVIITRTGKFSPTTQ